MTKASWLVAISRGSTSIIVGGPGEGGAKLLPVHASAMPAHKSTTNGPTRREGWWCPTIQGPMLTVRRTLDPRLTGVFAGGS